MSFDWSERLALAFELVGQPARSVSSEAHQRAAISSAYYAAFISARNVLRDQDGIIAPTLDAHLFVMHEFLNSPQSNRRQIGKDLKKLRGYRNEADYDDAVINLRRKTADTLVAAQDMLERLNRL